MSEKCSICGLENDDQLARSPLPKELEDKDENGNRFENPQPMCKKCFYFKQAVDINFVRLCEDTKLFETYRANSKRRSDFYPTELIYNIDVERLRQLYYEILTICEEADKIANDEKNRKEIEDELNYQWRKRDA